MIERLSVTRSGWPTVCVDSRCLHSRYDPRMEAEKYVESLTIAGAPRCFVLVEPGLEYLVPGLGRRFPEARILAVHCSPFLRTPLADQELAALPPERRWFPDATESLAAFLERTIPETELPGVQVIEWRASLEVYGPLLLPIWSQIADFLKRGHANLRTVQAFGPRWLKNAIRNVGLLRRALAFEAGDQPVVIAGAGPSLATVLPLLKKAKGENACTLVAVSSAVPALLASRLVPDLVIATDGGFWARSHLTDYLRRASGKNAVPFAAALTASLPSQLATQDALILADASLWQTALLRALDLPYFSAPQRGTVTATALDVALGLTTGTVYLAGFDLAHRDLLTHVTPYALDRLIDERANRFQPAYAQSFSRASQLEAGGALGVYAAWFKDQLPRHAGRLKALPGIHPGLSFLPRADRIAAAANRRAPRFFAAAPDGDPGNAGLARSGVAPAFFRLLDDPLAGAAIAEELGALLGLAPTERTGMTLRRRLADLCGTAAGVV